MNESLQITSLWLILALNGVFTMWLWWRLKAAELRLDESERGKEKRKRSEGSRTIYESPDSGIVGPYSRAEVEELTKGTAEWKPFTMVRGAGQAFVGDDFPYMVPMGNCTDADLPYGMTGPEEEMIQKANR